MVIVKETADSGAAERIARVLAAEWSNSAYTARRIITGVQAKTSPIQLSLSKSMRVGRLLRTAAKPVNAVLKETLGRRIFEGVVERADKKTEAGFTYVDLRISGTGKYLGSTLRLKAKNEVLVAYTDGKLAAIAPDIITPVHPDTGKCVTAEKIEKGNRLAILGLPAPQKWRTSNGLELWTDVLRNSSIFEEYVPLEKARSCARARRL
jgi:hypothetical protein